MHSRNYMKMTAALGLRFGPVRKGVTPKRILEYVLQEMIRIKDDSLLISDPCSVEANKGMFQTYRNVAHFIAPLTDIVSEDAPVVPTRAAPRVPKLNK